MFPKHIIHSFWINKNLRNFRSGWVLHYNHLRYHNGLFKATVMLALFIMM